MPISYLYEFPILQSIRTNTLKTFFKKNPSILIYKIYSNFKVYSNNGFHEIGSNGKIALHINAGM